MNDDLSEVANEDWTFDVVRTYVLGVELFDMNLSSTEFRLLLMLRIRASGGRNNHVSNETLAKDLNVKKNAIAGYMTNLGKYGYIVCKSRGYGSPTLKTIKSMVTRYDQDILKMTRKDLLGANRSDELLHRLHFPSKGHTEASQNDCIASSTLLDTTEDKTSSSTLLDTMESRKTVPLEVRKTVIKVDKEVNQNKVDSARFTRDANQTENRKTKISGEGDLYDADTGEVLDSVVISNQDLKREKFPAQIRDERDVALEGAANLVIQVAARSAKISLERQEKLAARKDQSDRSGATAERKRLQELQRAANKTTGGRFYDWARAEYTKFFPTIYMPKWMATEFSQVKMLVDAYNGDEELVRKAWAYCCEHWDHVTKHLKVADAAPTIGFLLAMRNRIFPLVQSRESDRDYKERTSTIGKKLGEW